MKQAAAHSTTKKSPQPSDPLAVMVVLGDLLDTTWRIAVPVVAGAVLGLVLDHKLGSKPWATLGLSIAGFAIAALLIKRQLKNVSQKDRS